jgi:hypothetical protein
MKLLTFILTINSIVCFGQNIFADDLKNFPWTSDEQLDIEEIQTTTEIGLSILKIPKDSLTINRTIWTFKDNLTLSHYNSKGHAEKIILSCKYAIEWDKTLLNIQCPNMEQLTYTFTFVSTGSFILLTRKTGKPKE